MSPVKVSVCIPTYRQVDFLRETLVSIQKQEKINFEVIVSDDSPCDNVKDLLKEFAFGPKLLYVRNKPSLGSPENWNAAIRLAQGEYIKILHHDDKFTSSLSLSKFVQLLDDNANVAFGFSASIVNDVENNIKRIHYPTPKQLLDLEIDPSSIFLGNCIGSPSATIYRKNHLINYDIRMQWLVDIDFYYRMLMIYKNFAYTAKPLIETTNNASHQLTQICRNNGPIELREALLMFEKFTPSQRENPLVKQGWSIIFRKYRMRRLKDFTSFGLPAPLEVTWQGKYFSVLLKRPFRIWHYLSDPKHLTNKILYKIYACIPSRVRNLFTKL